MVLRSFALAGGWASDLGAFHPATAHAQTVRVGRPRPLYAGRRRIATRAPWPQIPFGAAHLVWADPDEPTYYYSRWDGANWTTPADVIAATGSAELLSSPELVAAADGKLHLFWALGSVMHSWAWADAANSARAWSAPEPVVSPNGFASGPMGAVQDAAGRFHLVYSLGQQDVYYVHSDDEGIWSEPVRVSQVAPGASTSAPKLAVGPDGTVHVVWNEWPVATGPSQENQVFYARSTDGGASWSAPRQLGGLADSGGNVLAAADGSVYLVWQAGIASASQGRFLQRSTDGGATWEAPVNFSTVKAQSGTPSMALDSAGTLHVITGDGEYVCWNGHTVSPPLDLRPLPEQTENARLAVVAGNQVLAVVMPFFSPGVYYAVRQLSLPGCRRPSRRATAGNRCADADGHHRDASDPASYTDRGRCKCRRLPI